jgi:hypothetical protein
VRGTKVDVAKAATSDLSTDAILSEQDRIKSTLLPTLRSMVVAISICLTTQRYRRNVAVAKQRNAREGQR